MMPEEHLMTAFREEEFFLENLIMEYRLRNLEPFFRKEEELSFEFRNWLIRSGISSQSSLSQSHIGLYTDFT